MQIDIAAIRASLHLWYVFLPVGIALFAVAALPRFTRLPNSSLWSRFALGFFLMAQLSAIGLATAPYAHAPLGSEVLRLIPIVQFDPSLLQTSWLPDQFLLGWLDLLVAAFAFPDRMRNAVIATVVFVGFGLELNQASVNASGIIPQYRIDIHDVLARSAGALVAAFLLIRARRILNNRAVDARRKPSLATHAATQAPSSVLMIRPAGFSPNPETAVDNSFQGAAVSDPEERRQVAVAGAIEAAVVATALRGAGVEVIMYDDRPGIDTPDSVFPNNWISTHDDGRIVLYPMATPSRRRERRMDVVEGLGERFAVGQLLDLSPLETEGRYLEGTGALVLDHIHRIVYMVRSGRANEAALDQWCDAMGYTAEVFDAVDQGGRPIYHTNVLLSIGTEFVVAGLDSIPNPDDRARIGARLAETGREIVAIDPHQVAEFAGNGLELTGRQGRIFALSTRAAAALRPDQIATIEHSARIVAVAIPTIERSGGSLRCMLAGIHLPPRRTPAV